MAKQRQYKLEDIKFEGKGYRSIFPRKIRKSATCGLISVPGWLIGTEVDFIIIPKTSKTEEFKIDPKTIKEGMHE